MEMGGVSLRDPWGPGLGGTRPFIRHRCGPGRRGAALPERVWIWPQEDRGAGVQSRPSHGLPSAGRHCPLAAARVLTA